MSFDQTLDVLRQKWKSAGIVSPVVATELEVDAFEQRYAVRLTQELRRYFLNVNGTDQGYLGMDDEDLVGFWHLDQVRTFAEQELDAENADRTFAFADHSISIFTYGILLAPDRPAHASVVVHGGPSLSQAAASFPEFLERYVRGDKTVIYPPSLAQKRRWPFKA